MGKDGEATQVAPSTQHRRQWEMAKWVKYINRGPKFQFLAPKEKSITVA